MKKKKKRRRRRGLLGVIKPIMLGMPSGGLRFYRVVR